MKSVAAFLIFLPYFLHATDVAIVAYSRDALCIGVELVREYPLACTDYYPYGDRNPSFYYRYVCSAADGSLALYSYKDAHCSHGSELITVIHSSASDVSGTCSISGEGSAFKSSQLLCGHASEDTLLTLMPRIFDHRRVIMRHFSPQDQKLQWAEDTCVYYPSADPSTSTNSTNGVYAIFNVEIAGSRCAVASDDEIPEEDDGIGVPTRGRKLEEDAMVNYDVPMDICEITLNGAFGINLLDNDLTSYTTIHLSYPGDIYSYFLARSGSSDSKNDSGSDVSVLVMVALLGGLFAAIVYGGYVYVTDIAPSRHRRGNMSLLPQDSTHSSADASERGSGLINMTPLRHNNNRVQGADENDSVRAEEEATV